MRVSAIACLLCAALAPTGLAACGEDEPAALPEAIEVETAAGQDADAREPASETGRDAGGAVLTGTLPLLNGEQQDLAEYRGRVVLVVNTASECGFAPQFEGLERLYRQRRSEGLVVLGFPADDVAGQEPRSDEEIAEFCRANYGVSFPMFAKSEVLGPGANPVFRKLTAAAGEPSWNFNKYLLDREGRVVERFDVAVEPDDPALSARIDELLASG